MVTRQFIRLPVTVLNNWYYLRKMLATLTTIATPRYNEGLGMSGEVGCSLGPLLIVILSVYDSDIFYVITIHTYCDYPRSDSVQLGAFEILHFNRLSACVEAHWFKLHHIWIWLYHILCNRYFEIRTSKVLGWISTSILVPATLRL